jgi:hypothetical protein
MKAFSPLVFILALVAMACGGSPATVTPPTTTPAAVVSPTPAATPTPVVTARCTLPPLEPNDNCKENKSGKGDFQGEVQGAVARVRELKPQFFDGQIITQPEKYMTLLVQVLEDEFQVCAARKSDEVWVKKEQKYDEHYDVMAGGKDPDTKVVNWTYVVTCSPAAF